jgi:hypothetical protein
MGEFIREAVISTRRADGTVHLTPLGYRMRDEQVLLAPFHPSQTLENLRAHPAAVLNFTDDVRVFAGCLTGHRNWPTEASTQVTVPRLAGSLAHWELTVESFREDPLRPEFFCRVVFEAAHRAFTGYNRAQAAVIEASVLVSRLDWLEPAEVADEFARLGVMVDKTAGPREAQAWSWLVDAVAAHPRHGPAAVGGGR